MSADVWLVAIERITRKKVYTNAARTAKARLLDDCTRRRELGIARYGTPLAVGDGRSHIADGYIELLDALAYYTAVDLSPPGSMPPGLRLSAAIMSIHLEGLLLKIRREWPDLDLTSAQPEPTGAARRIAELEDEVERLRGELKRVQQASVLGMSADLSLMAPK